MTKSIAIFFLCIVLGISVWGVTPETEGEADSPVPKAYGYKYIDPKGNICFALSKEDVPEESKHPRFMSRFIEQESSAHVQKISMKDVDNDGEDEILVVITTTYPTGRMHSVMEVIKKVGQSYHLLASIDGQRGYPVRFLDLDGDGRLEFYGPHWGGPGELWVWDNGRYTNIIPRDINRQRSFYSMLSEEEDTDKALERWYKRWCKIWGRVK